MAKGGNKLMKFKSVLKKLNSFNTNKPNHQPPPAPATHGGVRSSSSVSAFPSEELHTVYVGRTRRPYHVSSDVVSHPLFQQLAAVDGGEYGSIAVSCEVVLFEHLLWMLENADTDESRPESVNELVEFYAC